jgi:hypothetical protein
VPWCPRCDETFPEGPACPRCSARLVARERETHEDTLESVPGLRQVKVSRRYLKALERLSATPRASSSRALAVALVLLVFATGFLLGRIGSVQTSAPTVHALPLVEPIPFEDVKGAVSYVLQSRDPLMTIAMHDLYSGDVVPRARFSPAVETADDVLTRAVSFGRSVAVVVSDGEDSRIAFAPHGRSPQGWLPGAEVAWMSETELVIRSEDDSLLRIEAGSDRLSTGRLGSADALFQTSAGAVVQRGRKLESVSGPKRRLKLPPKGEVLAVAPDVSKALLDPKAPALWTGEERQRVHAYDYGKVLGASFEPSGERAAVVMADGDELTLAVVMPRGNAAFKPLGDAPRCDAPPAWDGTGRWIYVASADGVLHAVEASGSRVEAVKTYGVGCGLAWLDVA